MGWNMGLTASCAAGDQATYSPDTSAAHEYTAAAFTAPKKGIYRFTLRGSGGHERHAFGAQAAGGAGGLTEGHLLLEQGRTVYVGCGGPCSAAWVASVNPGNAGVFAIAEDRLYFVAGGGGGGGSTWGSNGYGPCGAGGAGGGESGADGAAGYGSDVGKGGTQSTGGGSSDHPGGYGIGGVGQYTNNDDDNGSGGSGTGGDGGDGYFGGGAGGSGGSGYANGGGGGSGYVYAGTLTAGGRTYTSRTAQGGGAASNSPGSVTVTYAAPAELPVTFNGVRLTKIIFNGTELGGLVYNGTTVFAGRCKACLKRMAARFACLRATRASLASRWRVYRWGRETLRYSPCAEGTGSS